MRRNFRKKNVQNNKIMLYSIAGVLTLLAIIFAIISYGKALNKEANQGQLSSEQIASIVKNESDSQSASTQIGKKVEEASKNETKIQDNVNTSKTSSQQNAVVEPQEKNTNTQKTNNNNKEQSTKTQSQTKKNDTVKNQDTKKENVSLNFQMPVNGDIIKEFAKENLVFSETLQEWVTHNGIDIKAEKTTVVQAAEAGVVKTIKNDPRFGLTIVIEHENGFKTVYANLLSSEFVAEGEKVEKGQSIGTVGNTASFESADEPHLHFEILKDGLQLDPNLYIK